MANVPNLSVGDTAPDFELPDDSGQIVRLSDYRGVSGLVVYFYPKDETTGCTIESCKFRDEFQAFVDRGVEVFGVSADSVESHRSFKENHRLPFRLLSDTDNAVRNRYGVRKTLGLIPGRVTYLIDQDGIIQSIFNSQIRPKMHVVNALRVLDSLGR